MKKVLIIAVAVVAAVGLGVWTMSDSKPSAPNVAFTDLNGKTFHTEDLRGKVVLVKFWATDCTTCADPEGPMPDGPEDDPTVRALAADPDLMLQYNGLPRPYAGLESQLATNAAGWPRGRLQDAQWSERELNEARGEALAQMASTASTPTERTLLVDALGSTMSAMKDARLPSDEELRRELTAYRYSGAVTTTGVRIPVTTREGAEAALRAQRQQRMDYWHERATTLLDEGDVRGAMADIVRSAADSLDPKLVKGVATRLVEDVDAFVHPLLLPSSGREAGIAELAVLSDTRLFAGQATRQLARMVEELCDRNAELAGRVVAGIGHSAAAMARANEEAIDPDNPRRELEDVTDGELMQEAIERGLVRMGTEAEPTSGLH